MSMEDLLGALLQGGAQGQKRGGDPTAQLLQSLLGGGQQAQPQGGDLGSLLGALGGGQQQPAQGAGLESLLSSAAGAAPGAQPGGGLDLAALAQNPMVLQMLTPLITPLAQKLNISPQIAMIVVTFVLQALLANRGKKTAATTRGTAGFNLNGLLAQANSKNGITPAYVEATGMAPELSARSGLDTATASRGLLEVFQMLGQRAKQAGIKLPAVKKPAAKKALAKGKAVKKTLTRKPAAKKPAAKKIVKKPPTKKGGKSR